MQTANAALTSLFMKEFEWCAVAEGESAAILTESESSSAYTDAAHSALAAMGARPFQVLLPSRSPIDGGVPNINRGNANSNVLDDYPEVTELLKSIDFIVDLSLEGLIHSKQRGEILGSGTRTLLIKEPPDALERLLPTADRNRRIDRTVERLGGTKEMIVTSTAGTDLHVDLTGAIVKGAYGFCDKPGTSATWATCAVVAYPASNHVDGQVVLACGDIVFPFYRYVESPVTLRFKEGFVDEIVGRGLDAELFRDYFARWNDRNAYGISHVGWGLHENALWDALSFYPKTVSAGVDGRSFAGNFLISTGPNYAAGRQTRCHFDIPMRRCSIHIDNEPVVVEGRLVNRD